MFQKKMTLQHVKKKKKKIHWQTCSMVGHKELQNNASTSHPNTSDVSGSRKGQREVGAARQAADQTPRKRQPSPDLLPDGQDVGHPR